MTSRTLTIGRYISRRFAFSVVAVFVSCLMLIFLIDLVDLMRRGASHDSVSFFSLVLLSATRIPSFSEQLLPFAILMATIATYLGLSSKSELVIARSVGLSVWQFLLPSIIVAFLFGVVAVTLYNPLSATLKEVHLRLEAEVFGSSDLMFAASASGAWLRQEGVDGQTVIQARGVQDKGATLINPTFYVFDNEGSFVQRIEAENAKLKPRYWELRNAYVISGNEPPERYPRYTVSTYLTRTQVQESFADPETVSFWELQRFVALAERAGLPATAYRMQFQELLARPFYLCAMVLIAATTSLRVFRFGNIGRMVLGGIIAGFLLFVISKLLRDLGDAGLLNPVFAAWSPAVIGALAGLSILLYQEDG